MVKLLRNGLACGLSAMVLTSSLMWSPSCGAQQAVGTWSDVQQVQPGTRLVVVTRHRLSCTLVEVTDEEIVCEQGFRGLEKSRVEEVRLGAGRSGDVIGALIGGAAGGALASRSSGGNEGVKVFVGAALGGLVGGAVGVMTGHLHGEVIYRR